MQHQWIALKDLSIKKVKLHLIMDWRRPLDQRKTHLWGSAHAGIKSNEKLGRWADTLILEVPVPEWAQPLNIWVLKDLQI